jgi:hypothetical protein
LDSNHIPFAHLQVVYYKCVKLHKNPISRLGGVALTRSMDGRTDGWTDREIPIYPPNFACGGIIRQSKHAIAHHWMGSLYIGRNHWTGVYTIKFAHEISE